MDNILVVVEGNKTEPQFFKQLSKFTKNDIIPISYRGNIYHLYQSMKKEEYIDTIDMLIYEDNNIDQKDKEKLMQNRNKVPYIYLVFDFDYQHNQLKANSNRQVDINFELGKIKEMLQYFSNEANQKGKLLINYPMMESLKDLKDFNDKNYLDLMVDANFKKLTRYKQDVHNRGIKKGFNKFTSEDFACLVQINLAKINYQLYNKKECPDKAEYFQFDKFSQAKIYEKQLEVLHKNKKIIVLNSAILLYLELNPKILDSYKT